MSINKTFLDLTAGRDIVLKGGAGVVDNSHDYPDSLIVWANPHWISSDIVHVIYTAGTSHAAETLDDAREKGLQFVWVDSTSPIAPRWTMECAKRGIPFDTYQRRYARGMDYAKIKGDDLMADIQRWFNCVPFTGIYAAYALALSEYEGHKAKSLFVTGMDCYYDWKTGTLPYARGIFDLYKQAYMLWTLLNTPGWAVEEVRFDDRLLEVLHNPELQDWIKNHERSA